LFKLQESETLKAQMGKQKTHTVHHHMFVENILQDFNTPTFCIIKYGPFFGKPLQSQNFFHPRGHCIFVTLEICTPQIIVELSDAPVETTFRWLDVFLPTQRWHLKRYHFARKCGLSHILKADGIKFKA